MKRMRRIILGTISALAVITAAAGAAFAANNSPQVVNGNTDSSIYKAGSSVTISGTVNGDVYCAGQTINLDATVNGDVICAGQSVNVNGTVNGNVRVAGQSVSVGAKISKSLSVAAQQATLEPSSSVGQDATVIAQSADIEGPVSRDLHGTAGTLTLNSSVGRDASVAVNALQLNGSANVGRNLSYTSPQKYSKSGGAVVQGNIYYTYSNRMRHESGRWSWGFLLFQLLATVSLLIMGLVLVALFPQLFRKWDMVAAERVWKPLLIGFVATFVLPPLLLILTLTVFGAPLAILLAAACFVGYIIGLPLSAYFVGRRILRGPTSALLVYLLGAVILGLLFLVPILGEIVAAFTLWYGFGAVLLNVKRHYVKPQYVA